MFPLFVHHNYLDNLHFLVGKLGMDGKERLLTYLLEVCAGQHLQHGYVMDGYWRGAFPWIVFLNLPLVDHQACSRSA